MIFATLDDGTRDGELLIVDRSRKRAVKAGAVAATLQRALDRWPQVVSRLQMLSDALNAGRCAEAFDLDIGRLLAPLPRAYAFLDGSMYPHHMAAIRQARGDRMPADFFDKPLMYQGCSDVLIGPTQPLRYADDASFGIDIEAEIVVITGDVPVGTTAEQAPDYVRLLGLLNDISLRGIIPPEIARGFGFMQGKPASSMAPFAVTPDELGAAWNGRLLSGRYRCEIRGEFLGELDPSRDAAFDYARLIEHAARTRELGAGTILGAGALASAERSRGCGCIAELRAREQVTKGAATTPYLHFGDELYLEMFDAEDRSIFGAIRQRLERIPT